ncbi:hypothetical protein MRX96_037198 [Rhipicephalus microplus]
MPLPDPLQGSVGDDAFTSVCLQVGVAAVPRRVQFGQLIMDQPTGEHHVAAGTSQRVDDLAHVLLLKASSCRLKGALQRWLLEGACKWR